MRRALICGVSGQDGTYLAKLVFEKEYEVFGTSRDAQVSTLSNLHKLGIRERVQTLSMVLNDFRSVLHVLNKVEPDEVYNLSGPSSVGLSFEQPVEAMESINLGTLNLLEMIRFLSKKIASIMRGRASVLAIQWVIRQTRKRHSTRAALTQWRSALHIGRWRIIARLVAYSRVLGFFSITSHACDRSTL